MKAIAKRYGITRTPFRKWLAKYKAFASKAFIRTGHNALYSSAFKIKVVNAYLNREGSYEELSIKYKIHAWDTVRC